MRVKNLIFRVKFQTTLHITLCVYLSCDDWFCANDWRFVDSPCEPLFRLLDWKNLLNNAIFWNSNKKKLSKFFHSLHCTVWLLCSLFFFQHFFLFVFFSLSIMFRSFNQQFTSVQFNTIILFSLLERSLLNHFNIVATVWCVEFAADVAISMNLYRCWCSDDGDFITPILM